MTDLETAKDWITRFSASRPTCESCELSFEDVMPDGFEVQKHFAGYVRRCAVCKDARPNAWALKLDPERVAAWARDTGRFDICWALDEMRECL